MPRTPEQREYDMRRAAWVSFGRAMGVLCAGGWMSEETRVKVGQATSQEAAQAFGVRPGSLEGIEGYEMYPLPEKRTPGEIITNG